MRDAGSIARLAVGTGIVGYATLAALMIFFAVGQPFGTANDVGNGLFGLLAAGLALALGGRGASGRSSILLVVVALAAVLTVAGSYLVVSGTTGFFLAGLVSLAGFACIGLWLVIESRSDRPFGESPGGLARLGFVAGALMLLGFVSAPGIALGVDDMETAPIWVWLGSVGWIGAYVVYPAWAIRLGRAIGRGR